MGEVNADQFHEYCFVIFRIDDLPIRHVMGENHLPFVKKAMSMTLNPAFWALAFFSGPVLFHSLATLLLHLWVVLIQSCLIAGYNIVNQVSSSSKCCIHSPVIQTQFSLCSTISNRRIQRAHTCDKLRIYVNKWCALSIAIYRMFAKPLTIIRVLSCIMATAEFTVLSTSYTACLDHPLVYHPIYHS